MIYEVFSEYLEDKEDAIKTGAEVQLQVMDMDTFERKVVRCILAKSVDELPGSTALQVKDHTTGDILNPIAIKVVGEEDIESSIHLET